jgi:HK97 family phage prohead protease
VSIQQTPDEPVIALGEGIVSGYASVFGNVDHGGDRVMKGAFVDSIAAIKASGSGKLPLLWSHDLGDPWSVIGFIDVKAGDLYEDSYGLKFRATLDIGTNTKAAQVYDLFRRGVLTGVSFAYDVAPSGAKKVSGGVTELYKLNLHEATLCVMPMNELAIVTDVKSRFTKSQRSDALARWDADRRLTLKEARTRRLSVTSYQSPEEKATAEFLDNARQCVTCGKWLTTPPARNPAGYGYMHQVCSRCGTVALDSNDTATLTS